MNALHHSTRTESVQFATRLQALKKSATETEGNIMRSKVASVPRLINNIPIPKGTKQPDSMKGVLRTTLIKMKPGQSFMLPLRPIVQRKIVYDASYETGIKITTRKINGKGYRVWRVK